MKEPEKLYHEILAGLPKAAEGKMFGAKCLKSVNGKAAAIFFREQMMFKLEAQIIKKLLKLEGIEPGRHLYAPDKLMSGWVLVSSQHSDKWLDLAEKAILYVNSLKR